jgi:hypothetical protein
MPAETLRITHGRHCTCSACAREDWTRPDLGPCGMHGEGCPPVYAPLGPPDDSPADARAVPPADELRARLEERRERALTLLGGAWSPTADDMRRMYVDAVVEAVQLADALAALLRDAEKALADVHEYQCGCDQPGRLDLCVAQPVVVFSRPAAASVVSPGAPGRKLQFNPEPLAIVEERSEVLALPSLRGRSREDRLRVWLALGGTVEEFDADYPVSPGAPEETE